MASSDDIHVLPVRYYVWNILFLLFMLIMTVFVSFYHIGDVINVVIMLSIAIIKMLAVILVFMHVWWSSRLAQVFAAAGFLWLMIMIVLTFADYVTRDDATRLQQRVQHELILHDDYGSD